MVVNTNLLFFRKKNNMYDFNCDMQAIFHRISPFFVDIPTK